MEKVLCAAIYYNDGQTYEHRVINKNVGFVVCGYRHADCIETFKFIADGFRYPYNAIMLRKEEVMGFITNTNRFVDRQEAYKIAFAADQMIGPNKGYPENEIGLTSEDLY